MFGIKKFDYLLLNTINIIVIYPRWSVLEHMPGTMFNKRVRFISIGNKKIPNVEGLKI